MNMEDGEYSVLIELVEEQLRELGLGFLSDGDNYIVNHRDTGEPRLLPPRERLIEMLAVFDRYLATQDQGTVALALRRINEELDDGQDEDARFSPLVGDLSADSVYSLMAVPDLREVRHELSTLLVDLNQNFGPEPTPPISTPTPGM